MTITSAQCWDHYGDPTREKNMVLWETPPELHKGCIPAKIYSNADLRAPLQLAFRKIIYSGLIAELKTWNGCFCVRKKRASSSMSLHAWGLAVDVNAADNPMGATPKLSPAFVRCFIDAGFEWGGNWPTPDGMHFQLARLP